MRDTFLGSHSVDFSHFVEHEGNMGWFVALATIGGGSQIGGIRFENDARKGHRSFEDGRQGAFLKVTTPPMPR